jgi:orotidine-5'-phosphate decarboxylase
MPMPIIVALDTDVFDYNKTSEIINSLNELIDTYLVYGILFHPEYQHVRKLLLELGKDVIYDLKTDHIPSTTWRTFKFASMVATHITMQVTDDIDSMKMVVEPTLNPENSEFIDIEVIGTTILTSRTPRYAFEARRSKETVSAVAKGLEAGITTFLCPPLDLSSVRSANLGNEKLKLISPGIVETNQQTSDHTVVSTALEAIERGADQIIIGRSVMESTDPRGYISETIETIWTKINS